MLPQTDRATRYVSKNLVNSRKKLYNESTTNRSNGVRGLQLIDCSKQPRLVDCRIGVVKKLDCQQQQRRVLLTTQSTCSGEIFLVRSLAQSPRGKYPNFWREAYPIFFITQCGVDGRKLPLPKLTRFVQTDGRRDRQKGTGRQHIPRYSIASRGENLMEVR